jgi:GAF domain-containing protein
LNHLTRALNSVTSPEELLDLVEGEIAAALPSDALFIASYHPEAEMVEFHRIRDRGVSLAPFHWRLAPSLTQQVIATGQSLRIDERTDYPSVENPPQYYGGGPSMRSLLFVPIRLGHRVLGILSLQALQPHAYSEQDEQMLQTIADQAALAWERAQRAT